MNNPTIEHVNPADLVIGANVRLDTKTDTAFLASIRERGVLVPVVAHRDSDNEDRLTVLYGQRRTLAATEVGHDSIPVYVVATPDDASRIVDQLGENDHRAGLAATDHRGVSSSAAAAGAVRRQRRLWSWCVIKARPARALPGGPTGVLS